MNLFNRKRCERCRWWEDHGNGFEGFCRLRALLYPNEFGSREEVCGIISPACWSKHDEVRTSPDFGCNQWERK